jgi:hypothetical protein
MCVVSFDYFWHKLMTIMPVTNKSFAIAGGACFADILVVADSFVLCIKFSGKNPAHRKSAKRYRAFYTTKLDNKEE